MIKNHFVKKMSLCFLFFLGINFIPIFLPAEDLYKKAVPEDSKESEELPFELAIRKQFNILNSSKKRWRLNLGEGDMKVKVSRTAPSVFVQAHYSTSEKYFLMGKFDYLNRFGNRTYTYTAGGGYYIHPRIILSDLFSYAPVEYGIPKIQNAFEMTTLLSESFQFYFRYTYRLYNVANAHSLSPGMSWHFTHWGVLDFSYDPTITKVENKFDRDIDYSIPIRLSFIPLKDVLKLSVAYSRTKESFDKDTHEKTQKFEANHFGGGIEWIVANNLGVRMDIDFEKRDNGFNAQIYTSSIYYQF